MSKFFAILLLIFSTFSFAPLASAQGVTGVIDNFVPLSEGDPSQPSGPAAGDSNPFRQDLSNNVSKELPSDFTRAQGGSPILLVTSIIRMLLSLLGMIAIGLMVYAGFRWMTSAGNDEQVGEAKKTLRNATIGLILIFMSWSIVFWVTRRIQVSTSSFGTGGTFGVSTDGVEVGPVGRFE